jgi:mitochondrial fission protein ELM1
MNNFAQQSPRIWVLLSQKPGDNNQCIALADAIGLPYAIKRLDWPAHRSEEKTLSRELLADTVEAATRRQRLELAEPWPNAVICCGRRTERFALWIKAQTQGESKIFKIGRASRPLRSYDLLIATPQFPVPPVHNVAKLNFPPTLDAARNATGVQNETAHDDTLSSFPKPWFAILLGGEVKQFKPASRALRAAACKIQDAADLSGGSVVISTSRRTSPKMLSAVLSGLTRPPYLYRWSTERPEENPYATLLGNAAAVFITADSVSMMMDALAFGTPTFVLELPERFSLRNQWERRVCNMLLGAVSWSRQHERQWMSQRLYDVINWAHDRKIARLPKDLSKAHASLYATGLAQPLSNFDPSAIALQSRVKLSTMLSVDLRDVADRCRGLLNAQTSEPMA